MVKTVRNIFYNERTDQAITDNLRQVCDHLRRGDIYKRGVERKWDQRYYADPWLVAAGITYPRCAVVTNEKMPDPLTKGGHYHEPKIPFVCRELGAECVGVYGMMDELCIVADSRLRTGHNSADSTTASQTHQ